METIVVEDKIRLKVDITKVYWCTKLGSERNRIIKTFFKAGQRLCDMFCGIGPLTVKAVKTVKDFSALANDLNPDAITFLEKNLKINKIEDSVLVYNMDAR